MARYPEVYSKLILRNESSCTKTGDKGSSIVSIYDDAWTVREEDGESFYKETSSEVDWVPTRQQVKEAEYMIKKIESLKLFSGNEVDNEHSIKEED